MAVSLASSRLQSTTEIRNHSLSCGTKVFASLAVQSPNFHGVGKLNIHPYRSIWSRTYNGKPTRGRVSMKPVAALRVRYRNEQDKTNQMVDLNLALQRQRVIVIGKFIDDDLSNKILALMLYLDSIETKRFNLMINGPGGDLTPTMAIYDTMQSLQSPVATHCFGQVYNMSSFILAAGDKGHRTATRRSRICIMPPAGVARGQADDICNETEELLRIRDYLYKELAQKTGHSIDKIREDVTETKNLNAEEAVEYGIIDRVIRPPPLKPLEKSKMKRKKKRRSTEGLG